MKRKTRKKQYLHDKSEEFKDIMGMSELDYLKTKKNKYSFVASGETIKIKKVKPKKEDMLKTQERLLKELEEQKLEDELVLESAGVKVQSFGGKSS